MRFAITIAILLLASALILATIAFISYDVLTFQSRRSDISALIARSTTDEQIISPKISHLVHVSLNGHAAAFVARILIDELHVPWLRKGQLGWHITAALWQGCVALHLTEQEQMTLIASRSYMGNGRYGFSAEAMARFQHPLSEASLSELSTLVALTHSPTAYASSPERLAQRRDWLLSQVQSGF